MQGIKADTPPAFKIAATPISKEEWLTQNTESHTQIAAKKQLLAQRLGDVWCDNGQCFEAQQEALEEISAALGIKPQMPIEKAPLLSAAQWVQDDLVLMQKTPQGWVLAAGAVCFPSSWTLADKFNKPLDHIHQEVPGFGPKSRNAQLIARMFDHLAPDAPIMRGNWGLLPDDELFHPTPHRIPTDFTDMSQLTYRHERQTLLKLKRTGAILFTIRITLWPLSHIKAEKPLKRSFIEQIESLNGDEIRYKAIMNHTKRLLDWLNQA